MHHRTVLLINYHLSELLKQSRLPGRNTESLENDNENDDSGLISSKERQKMRKQIADQLIREDWTPEAMNLVEKAKAECKDLQDFFFYEMKVLIHDSHLATHKRHQRLIKLIEKV